MSTKKTPTDQGKFEIIALGVTVATVRHANDPAKKIALTGDVARLSSGRTVARVRTADGLFRYGAYDPSTELAELESAVDHDVQFKIVCDKLLGKVGLAEMASRPDPTEAERFLRLWPFIGQQMIEKLGIKLPDHVRFLFDPGVIVHPKADNGDDRTYFERHVGGNFGENGAYDSKPFSDEESFMCGSLPIDRSNSYAIATGNGVVKSRYGEACVTTIISNRVGKTLVYKQRMLEY